MMEETFINLLNNFGFPVAVTGVLLWDKIRTNGSLLRVVENNSQILNRIEDKIQCQQEK